jgi:hypothetical protein
MEEEDDRSTHTREGIRIQRFVVGPRRGFWFFLIIEGGRVGGEGALDRTLSRETSPHSR